MSMLIWTASGFFIGCLFFLLISNYRISTFILYILLGAIASLLGGWLGTAFGFYKLCPFSLLSLWLVGCSAIFTLIVYHFLTR